VAVAFAAAIAGTRSSGSTSAAVDLSARSAGELAFVLISRSNTDAPGSTPSGWTLLEEQNSTYRVQLYYKVLASGDIGTVTWSGYANSVRTAATAFIYTGQADSSPVAADTHGTGTWSTTGARTIDFGSLASTSRLMVGFASWYGTTSRNVNSQPSGMTERYDNHNTTPDWGHYAADQLWTSGTYAPSSSTNYLSGNATYRVGVLVALAHKSTAPAITGLSPAKGLPAGGTSVVITGTDFTGATAVKFGGTNAASYTVDNDLQITATTPAKSAGTYQTQVTTPDGSSSDVAADNFEFTSALPPWLVAGQVAYAYSSGSTASVALPGNVTNGNTVIVFGDGGDGCTFTGVSKTAGTATIGTPVKVIEKTDGGTNADICLWYVPVTGTGSLTLRVAGLSDGAIMVAEYAYIASSSPVADSDSGSGSSGNYSTAALTAPANSLIVAGFTNHASGCTITPDANWTERVDHDTAAQSYIDRQVTSAGDYTPGATPADNTRAWSGVGAVFKNNASSLTQVSSTMTAQYDVRQLAAKTATAQYDVRGLAAKTGTLHYDICGLAATTLTARYDSRALATKTLTARYDVIQHIATALDARYDLRGIVSDTLTTPYDVRGLVADTVSCVYDSRQLAARTLTAPYDVRQLGSRTLTARYGLRQLAGDTLTALYDVRQLGSASATIRYDLRQLAARTLTAAYDVCGLASRTLTGRYDVRQLAAGTATLRYDILSTVPTAASALTLRYDLRQLASDTLTVPADINGLVADTLTGAYDVRGLAADSLDARYDVRSLAASSATLRYDVRTLGATQMQVRYDLRQLASDTLTAAYDLRQLGGGELQAGYDIRALAAAQLSAVYGLRGLAAATVTGRYDLRELAAAQVRIVYSILLPDLPDIDLHADLLGALYAAHLLGSLTAADLAGATVSVHLRGQPHRAAQLAAVHAAHLRERS